MALRSPEFAEGQEIPARYAADGENLSPPLEWDVPPQGTESFAIIVEDPDAPKKPVFCHWVIYNIPAGTMSIGPGIPEQETLGGGEKQGTNDFGKVGYAGPKPPSGTHRYIFRLFALDRKLDIDGEVDRNILLQTMRGHILAEATLKGTYTKRSSGGEQAA